MRGGRSILSARSEIFKQADRQFISLIGFGFAGFCFYLAHSLGIVSGNSFYSAIALAVAVSTFDHGKIFIPLAIFVPVLAVCAICEYRLHVQYRGNGFHWTKEALKATAGPLLTLLSTIAVSLALAETLTGVHLPAAPYSGLVVALASFIPAMMIGFVLDELPSANKPIWLSQACTGRASRSGVCWDDKQHSAKAEIVDAEMAAYVADICADLALLCQRRGFQSVRCVIEDARLEAEKLQKRGKRGSR